LREKESIFRKEYASFEDKNMNNRYQNLLSPIQIGKHKYKNRVINAPRGGIWNFDPDSFDADIEQLMDAKMKCSGEIAAYEIGETAVSAIGGRGANEFYGFDDMSEGHTRRYRQYAEQIHRYGAKALVELNHMGAEKPEASEDAPAHGPVDCVNEAGVRVKGMSLADIEQTCKDFAKAALFMKNTGYDGVVVHCGHGWLPHQFLSLRWNSREDEFGGSLENRSRLTVMILDAIREACGEDFLIECRLSGQENREDGYSIEEIVGYCQIIQAHCDSIHVSAGIYNQPMETKMVSTLYDAHGCNVYVAEEIKKHVQIPVAVVGGINNPDDAESWIAEGKCDMVVLCRQLQSDSQFALKTMQGKSAQIRKCLRCMRCYPGPFEEAMEELGGEFPEGCSVNPYLEYFDRWDDEKSKNPKKLLVIGGGVGGMQAAISGARYGHAVTLIEKKDRLGGILNFAEDDQDKYDLKALADAMAAEVADSDIRLLLNTEANEEMIKGYDYVILAIGSSPAVPPIPGVENCMQAIDAYKPSAKIGDKVVMLGGGLVGCETAIHLSKQGKTVALVERADGLVRDAYRLHKHKVRQIIEADPKISVYCNTDAWEIFPDKVTVVRTDVEGEKLTLEGDTVISALGMKANDTSALEEMIEKAGISYKKIGDCVRARKIYDAITEGFLAVAELG
jgi:2,4-dienoyl-CoA reductase-like NADH-dependent reductase (Old Yellow Enzyme family)/thioredoxin reductase